MASNTCCTKQPNESKYESKGKYEKVNGIDVYSVGPADSKLAVVVVYDIFGYHPNTLRTIDELSAALNARVVAPDYFKGEPYPLEKFPIKDIQEFLTWLNAKVPEAQTREETNKVCEGLKQQGHSHIGTLGFCWGAKICLAAAEGKEFSAGHVFVHPSFFKTEDADNVNSPILLLPSMDEIDFNPFLELLKNKKPEIFAKSGHHRFDDVFHGWAAARGDWNNELFAKRTVEAISLSKKFYENNIQ